MDYDKRQVVDNTDESGRPKKSVQAARATGQFGDPFENTVMAKKRRMIKAFGEGFQKQMQFNKINIISTDHMNQLLSRSRGRMMVSPMGSRGHDKVPSIEESIS